MQAKNFKVVDSTGIEFLGQFLDLHSNYDFTSVSYDVCNKSVEMCWKKCSGSWAENEKYQKLKLKFSSVSVFSVRPRDGEKPFSEDDCLSYLGFLHPDDLDLMDGFLPPDKSEDGFHLVFGFESELVIKLYADSVELISSEEE